MKFAKKMIGLLMAAAIAVGLMGSLEISAKAISIATPKITVSTVKKGTGVKIRISKTKDADGYEVNISGKSEKNKDYSYYVVVNGELQRADNISVTELIEKDGKAARTITIKYLPEGNYTVKVRSYKNIEDGTLTYSEYTEENKFTLKKQSTKGNAKSYNFSKVKQGDVIEFGSYEQDLDYTNGKEPIEWIVLKKSKKQMLVVSKYVIDKLPYNKDFGDITWETCTLRKWLNKVFINTAFNKNEKNKIKTVTVENWDNAVYKTPGGEDTKDKVFLLSQLDMIDTEFGFADAYGTFDVKRRCAYAWDKGKADSHYPTADGEPAWWWWLRSPGRNAYDACYVYDDGSVGSRGDGVGYSSGVRPALFINL